MGKTKVEGQDVTLELEAFVKTRSKHRSAKKKAPKVARASHALFFLPWLAPLVLITVLHIIMGERSILDGPVNGDWREVWQVALAGLVCGLFWEMWNYWSLAHWGEYAVPFVHRFEIFHMPLLGYSGYLPFGLECLAVAKLLDLLWEGKRRGQSDKGTADCNRFVPGRF